jgi:hypothetical protein
VTYITGQIFGDRERHGLFRELEQLVERPIFGVETHGRRADKRAGFNSDSGALRNFGNGANVVAVRARGAVRANPEFLCDDLARQLFDARRVCAARAGQPDVRRVDAEIVHQVQQFEFSLHRRLAHGRRLQPVAQSFIVETDVATGRWMSRINLIPVVDQFTCRHFHSPPLSGKISRVQRCVLSAGITTRGGLNVKQDCRAPARRSGLQPAL